MHQACQEELIDFLFGEEVPVGAKRSKKPVLVSQADKSAYFRVEEGFSLEVKEHAPEVGVQFGQQVL